MRRNLLRLLRDVQIWKIVSRCKHDSCGSDSGVVPVEFRFCKFEVAAFDFFWNSLEKSKSAICLRLFV